MQNLLRISKLFGVTADYLLNDDFDGDTDIPDVEAYAEETNPAPQKKKRLYWYLIPAICFVILSACAITEIVKNTNAASNEVHTHPALRRVIENEVAPTCTEQGAYDEVLYCAECGEEVLRTHINTGTPAHQFQNEKCIVCGED